MRPFGCPDYNVSYLRSPRMQSNLGLYKRCDNASKARVETVPGKDYILLPFFTQDLLFSSSTKDSPDAGFNQHGGRKRMLKLTE
ncbi:hypothetical protein Tco_1409918 [Tanacetum coccineum]